MSTGVLSPLEARPIRWMFSRRSPATARSSSFRWSTPRKRPTALRRRSAASTCSGRASFIRLRRPVSTQPKKQARSLPSKSLKMRRTGVPRSCRRRPVALASTNLKLRKNSYLPRSGGAGSGFSAIKKAGFVATRPPDRPLDRPPLGRRMSKGDRANFGDIAERNPTEWARSRSVDASHCVRIIESQGRAEPHFHQPARLNDSKVQARDCVLDLLLGIAQRERYAWWPAKRNEKKPSYVGILRCIHEVQLSGCINRFNRVSRLPCQGRGGSRDHCVHAAASGNDRLRVFQVTNAQFDTR